MASRGMLVAQIIIALLIMIVNTGPVLVTHDHAAAHGEVECTEHHHENPCESDQGSTDGKGGCASHTHYVGCSCPKVPADHHTASLFAGSMFTQHPARWTDYQPRFVEEPDMEIFQPPKV